MTKRAGLLALFLLFFGCSGKSTESASAARARVGAPAPAFDLPAVSGPNIKLSDYKGKVVLLDFWATWCPPCRASTPALVRLDEKYKGQAFTVIGISLDDDKDAVAPFLKKEGVKHPVAYGAGSSVDEDYSVRAIPSFFILDRNGVVQKHYEGFYPGMDREWASAIDSLLGKK